MNYTFAVESIYLPFNTGQEHVWTRANLITPLSNILEEWGGKGYALVEVVDEPGSFTLFGGSTVSKRTLIFQSAEQPTDDFLQRMVNKIDEKAKDVVTKEISAMKMELQDQLTGITRHTLSDQFMKELVDYMDAALAEKLEIMKAEIIRVVKP